MPLSARSCLTDCLSVCPSICIFIYLQFTVMLTMIDIDTIKGICYLNAKTKTQLLLSTLLPRGPVSDPHVLLHRALASAAAALPVRHTDYCGVRLRQNPETARGRLRPAICPRAAAGLPCDGHPNRFMTSWGSERLPDASRNGVCSHAPPPSAPPTS